MTPRLRSLLAVSISIFLILNAPFSIAAATTFDKTGPSMKVVGELPVFEPGLKGGWLVLNPRLRRGYQIFDVTAQNTTVIWSFDLDTLQPIRRATMPVPLRRGGKGGDLVHAVDEEGGRIFFVTLRHPEHLVVARNSVVVFDEERFDQGESDFVAYWVFGVGLSPSGIAFTREGGRAELFLGLEFNAALGLSNAGQLHVVKLDPQTGLESGRVDVSSVCGKLNLSAGGEGIYYHMELLRRPGALYVGCEGPSVGPATVVKIPMSSSGEFAPVTEIRAWVLPRRLGAVVVDRRWGRLIVEAAIGGSSLWVFDTKADSWVGGIGLIQGRGVPSLGIDHETGRLYALVPDDVLLTDPPQAVQGGFQFSDLALTPVPQLANTLPKLAHHGHTRIVVDPEGPGRPRRVFVRRGHPVATATYEYPSTSVIHRKQDDFFTIVEDTAPVTLPPSWTELDRNTVDVMEEPDVTGANFEALGSGFGLRALWLSGVTALTSNTYRDNITNNLTGNCAISDREMVFGWSQSGKLSSLGASARAVSFDADLTTRDDLKNPAARCWPLSALPPNVTGMIDSRIGEQWRDFTAECVGTKEDFQTQGAPGRFTQGAGSFTSSADCKYDEERVETSASGFLGPGGDSTPIKVAFGSSNVVVKRDPEGGVVVEVTSVARGIEIPGVGSLAMVEAKAISRAGGRPGTAETVFVRTICRTSSSCISDESEQQRMIDDLNRLLQPLRGTAYLRSPDPELSAGSPGGYLAAIQRDRRDGPFDRDVNRDHSLTVPGLEIIFYRGDSASSGSGRHIYQLAAVQAESAYGIYCRLGQSPDGKCNMPVVDDDLMGDMLGDSDPESFVTLGVTGSGELGGSAGAPSAGLREIVRRIIEKIAEGLRLLFSSPKEAALMAAVWLLFWIPSYLGERRRMLLGV